MSSGKANNIVGDWHINGTQVTATAAQLNTLTTLNSNQIRGGEYTVQAADDTANQTVIATGLTTITNAIVQIKASDNKIIVTADAATSWSAGNLTVADGTVYAMAAGQKISWLAFGS